MIGFINIFFILGTVFCQVCLVSSCHEVKLANTYIEDNYLVTGSGLYHKCWFFRNTETNLSINLINLNLQKKPSSDGSLTIELKSENKILKYWSKSRLDSFSTNSSLVEIHFEVNSDHFLRGRTASFKLHVEKVCGIYTEPSGNIKSPRYPNSYSDKETCIYEIRLSAGYLINITFHDVELENHELCNYDYLQVHDGNGIDSQLITKLCGNIIPEPIVSTSNNLWMKFVSDQHKRYRGFHASYSAVKLDAEAPMTTSNDERERIVEKIAEESEENLEAFFPEDDSESDTKAEKLCTCANGTISEPAEKDSHQMEVEEYTLRMEVLELQKKYEIDRIKFQKILENERLEKIRFETESLRLLFAENQAEKANRTD